MTENPESTITFLNVIGYGIPLCIASWYFARWMLWSQRAYDNRPRRLTREGGE